MCGYCTSSVNKYWYRVLRSLLFPYPQRGKATIWYGLLLALWHVLLRQTVRGDFLANDQGPGRLSPRRKKNVLYSITYFALGPQRNYRTEKMLRSTFEASVRPISVWSRLHSPRLARKRPTRRLVPAVATFNCHSLHTSRTREMWTQNKTSLPLIPLRPGRSIELGATFVGAGAVRLLHNNNSETPGQPAPAAAASAVER